MAQVASAQIMLEAAGGNAVLRELQDVDNQLGRLGSSGERTGGTLSNFGSGVLGGAVVAGAQMASSAIAGIVSGLGGLVASAFDATTSYERLTMSLESLTARELRQASAVERIIGTSTSVIRLTAEQQGEVADLGLSYRQLEIDIAQASARQAQLAARGDALGAEEQGIRIQRLSGQLAELGGEMGGITSQEGRVVTTVQKVTELTLSMADALDQARPAAANLLNWVQQLAIKSPFNQEGVSMALKTAMTYGFTTEEAKRLTQATIDFAAATGAGTFEMDRISRALGQMSSRGKVSMQEILQLSEAGVPAMQILQNAFGKTGAELETAFRRGEITADQAIEAIVSALESDFGGAAARTTETLGGLMSSFQDLQQMGMREFFAGVFSGAQPALIALVDGMSDDLIPAAAKLGKVIGDNLEEPLMRVADVLAPAISITSAFLGLWSEGRTVENLFALRDGVSQLGTALGLDPSKLVSFVDAIMKISGGDLSPITTALQDMIPPALMDSFQTLGDAFKSVFDSLASTAPAAQEGFQSFIDTLSSTVLQSGPQTISNIADVLTMLAEWWAAYGPTIIAGISWLADAVVTVLGGAMAMLTGILTTTMQFTRGEWDAGWATMGSSLQVFADAVLGIMGTTWSEVAGIWVNNWEMLKLIVSTALEQLGFAVSFRMGLIKTFIIGGISDAKNAVMHTIDSWVDMGRQIVDGIVTGIRATAASLYNTIYNLARSALEAAKAALGINSPSKMFMEIGVNTIEGFTLGVNREANTANSAVSGVMGGATSAAAGALPTPAGMGGGSGPTNNVTITVMAQSFDDIVREAAARGYEFAAVA